MSSLKVIMMQIRSYRELVDKFSLHGQILKRFPIADRIKFQFMLANVIYKTYRLNHVNCKM